MNRPLVSILLCTANRPQSLRDTLASLSQCTRPPFAVELFVVENGCQPEPTESVVRSASLPSIQVHYLFERNCGKCAAYNLALAKSSGSVLLSTDDDVRFPVNWIVAMSQPILSGAADAVAGGVRIPPHLLRPWMDSTHKAWLACTDFLDRQCPSEMVGCNMGWGRQVLNRVPKFDVELGPGALGLSDDSLFSRQITASGFRIAPLFEVEVEHHFDPSRLSRYWFLKAAERRGRSEAYLRHHWEHVDIGSSRSIMLTMLKRMCRLQFERARRLLGSDDQPAPSWELKLLYDISLLKQWLIESRRPRNYMRYGCEKLAGQLSNILGTRSTASVVA